MCLRGSCIFFQKVPHFISQLSPAPSSKNTKLFRTACSWSQSSTCSTLRKHHWFVFFSPLLRSPMTRSGCLLEVGAVWGLVSVKPLLCLDMTDFPLRCTVVYDQWHHHFLLFHDHAIAWIAKSSRNVSVYKKTENKKKTHPAIQSNSLLSEAMQWYQSGGEGVWVERTSY